MNGLDFFTFTPKETTFLKSGCRQIVANWRQGSVSLIRQPDTAATAAAATAAAQNRKLGAAADADAAAALIRQLGATTAAADAIATQPAVLSKP